jgi:PEP-CTERM motif
MKLCVAKLMGATLLIIGVGISHAQAATIEYTTQAAFDAAVTNEIVTGFNGILAPGQPFANFSPLVVNGITFFDPVPGVAVNVTTANFYAPNTYPADFIVDSGNPGPNNELLITLPTPTHAFAMHFGGLFTGGAATITLGNGAVFAFPSTPTVGQTQFVGFTSDAAFSTIALFITNDSWVVQDVITATPAAVPEPATILLLGTGLLLIGRRRVASMP